MSELKMIDELLCTLKQVRNLSWEELEFDLYLTQTCMSHLREKWRNNEYPPEGFTLSLVYYFAEGKHG